MVLAKLLTSLIHRFFITTGNGTTSRAGKRLGVHMRSVNGGYHSTDIGGENLVLSWSFLCPQPPWKQEQSFVQHSDCCTPPQEALLRLLQLLVALVHSRIPAVPSPSLGLFLSSPQLAGICLASSPGGNLFTQSHRT